MGCCGDDDENNPDAPRNDTVKVRGCTDVFWLCLFILFWFLMILIAAFAIVYGNPLRLTNGYDSFGNICGTPNNEKFGNLSFSGLDTSEKKYLFFMDLAHLRKSLKICVKKCPDRNLETIKDLEEFHKQTGSLLCRYDFDFAEADSTKWRGLDKQSPLNLSSSYGPCPPLPVYDGQPVLNRCIPRPVKALAEQVISNLYAVLNGWDVVEQVLGDLYATWREILALILLAFLLSLLMVAILHYLASVVAWVFMLLVSIASVVGTCMLWWTYIDIKWMLDKTPNNQLLDETVRNETAFLVYSIVATIITVILLLLVFVMRKRVKMLAQLFKESAKCMADLPLLFAQPLLTFLCLLAFFVFWLFIVVCLATCSYPNAKHDSPFLGSDPAATTSPAVSLKSQSVTELSNISFGSFKSFTKVEFVESSWVRYMWWVYLVGLIWTSEFILACQQMVIAGAVADWYFSRKHDGNASVTGAMGKLISYHLGSMAKGSFLITIFKLPRLVLTYVYAKMKAKEEGSECARCGLKGCICCFWCLERFIRFLNHNAYTVIAIDGSHFCSAAKTQPRACDVQLLSSPASASAFPVPEIEVKLAARPVGEGPSDSDVPPAKVLALNTIVSNALQFATLNSVGDFILFLGKCFVTAATGSVGLLYLKHNETLKFYAAPVLAVCVFAFFVAHCILSLYEMVIDTLFLCTCEDQRINGDGGHWRESFLAGDQQTNRPTELEPINNV